MSSKKSTRQSKGREDGQGDCPLCIERFNKSNHKRVECRFCQYAVCIRCIKKYLLDSSQTDVACMNCQLTWSSETVRSLLPQTFLCNEYKAHRENVLLSLEESMMPETQDYIAYEKQKEADYATLSEITKQIRRLEDIYNQRLNELNNRYRTGYRGYRKQCEDDGQNVRYIMKCPSNDCRGFVSNRYKCGQCDTVYCKDCFAVKQDGHECKEEDRQTVELLHTNTKRCPNCSISIFKIDGCNQIFCTECHTAFDWASGRKINGPIHNPHYFEWLRTQNDAEGLAAARNNVGCAERERRVPDVRMFAFCNPDEYRTVTNMIQKLHHIRHVVLPTMTTTNDRFLKNRDIRVGYMKGDITRDHFKWLVQKRDKADQKKLMQRQLWEMCILSGSHLLHNYIIHRNYNEFTQEGYTLKEYINTEFARIAKLYNCRAVTLNERWASI